MIPSASAYMFGWMAWLSLSWRIWTAVKTIGVKCIKRRISWTSGITYIGYIFILKLLSVNMHVSLPPSHLHVTSEQMVKRKYAIWQNLMLTHSMAIEIWCMHLQGTCMGWNARMLFYFVGVIINFLIISIITMRGIWTRGTFFLEHQERSTLFSF